MTTIQFGLKCPTKQPWDILPPTSNIPSRRRLQLQNPKSIELYLAELKKRLLEHNIPARIFALEQSVLANPNQPLTPAQVREANTIDNLRKQAMLGAEKKCRTLRMGNIPYSLETATIGNEIRYWAAVVKRILKHRISSTYIKFLKKKAGINEPTRQLHP